MGRLSGKTALITGGGSGHGRATVHRFVEEGAQPVFVLDKLKERCEKVAAEAAQQGSAATAIHADVGNRDDCRRAIDMAVEQAGRLDILVSNAAAWTQEPFLDMKWDSWDYVLNVNLNASFILGQLAARVMNEQGGGVILYTASIDFKGAAPQFSHYGVSKAAIVNLVKNMAIELAPYNIRVNSISPGPSDTQQSVDIVGEETMKKFRADFPVVPLRRLGMPEDMAAAFAFLASDDASYITGHNIVVDGGLIAHAYSIPPGGQS